MIAICASGTLADGGDGVRFGLMFYGEPCTGFVVRFRGVAYGYLNRCSHVAMELDWLEGVFFDDQAEYLMCATHGALYDAATGGCVGGPCLGRGGLRRLDVMEQDGTVWWRPGEGMAPQPKDQSAA